MYPSYCINISLLLNGRLFFKVKDDKKLRENTTTYRTNDFYWSICNTRGWGVISRTLKYALVNINNKTYRLVNSTLQYIHKKNHYFLLFFSFFLLINTTHFKQYLIISIIVKTFSSFRITYFKCVLYNSSGDASFIFFFYTGNTGLRLTAFASRGTSRNQWPTFNLFRYNSSSGRIFFFFF